MLIDRLSQECLERLSRSLEKGPTVNWQALATKGFPRYYSEGLAQLQSSTQLLDDLTSRHVTVQELLRALDFIGNKRAGDIVREGKLVIVIVHYLAVIVSIRIFLLLISLSIKLLTGRKLC